MSLALAALALTQISDFSNALGLNQPNAAEKFKGPKGDVGLTGPQGVAGAVGPTGPKGDVGAQGPKGAAGTAILSYAGIFSAANQTNASQANSITGLSTLRSSGVTLRHGTEISLSRSGTYSLQVEANFANSASGAWQASLWIEKNGILLPHSRRTLNADTAQSDLGFQLISTFAATLKQSDKLTLHWAAESPTVYLTSKNSDSATLTVLQLR